MLGSQKKVFLSSTVRNPRGESEDMWERSPLCSVQSKGLIWFGEVKWVDPWPFCLWEVRQVSSEHHFLTLTSCVLSYVGAVVYVAQQCGKICWHHLTKLHSTYTYLCWSLNVEDLACCYSTVHTEQRTRGDDHSTHRRPGAHHHKLQYCHLW